MRAIGIDPGTKSFDFFGMEDDDVILDASVPSEEVARNPEVILEILRSVRPVDIIVGPSGYGIPLTSLEEATEEALSFMLPQNPEDVSVNEGIKRVFRLMKAEGFPTYFTPGVIHLPTVPIYRKANKLDMGTADKVCCVALGIKDQAEYYGIDFRETSFILVEVGYGFTAVIAVKDGEIIDGLGGTSGGPGFLTAGALDFELAIRLPKLSQSFVFTGGARDMAGEEDLTPEKLAKERERYRDAWEMLMESIAKGVAAMKVSLPDPREILLSGRLARIPEIEEELKRRLGVFGEVRRVRRRAKTAKEAAEGACIIGEGLMGGRYRGIVEALKLREAKGTMFDYVLVKGAKEEIFPTS